MALPYVTENKVEKIINQQNNFFYIDLKDTLIDLEHLDIDITSLVDIDEFKKAINSNKFIVVKNVNFLDTFNMRFIKFDNSWTHDYAKEFEGETINYTNYFTNAWIITTDEKSFAVVALISATIAYVDESAIVFDDYKNTAGKVILHIRFLNN